MFENIKLKIPESRDAKIFEIESKSMNYASKSQLNKHIKDKNDDSLNINNNIKEPLLNKKLTNNLIKEITTKNTEKINKSDILKKDKSDNKSMKIDNKPEINILSNIKISKIEDLIDNELDKLLDDCDEEDNKNNKDIKISKEIKNSKIPMNLEKLLEECKKDEKEKEKNNENSTNNELLT